MRARKSTAEAKCGGRDGKRTSRVGLNRDSVLDVAVKIVSRDGLDALTIAGLARALSIQPPSIYNHFNRLADLRRALLLRAMRQLREELRNVVMGLAREDALRAISHAYRNFAKRLPGLYLLMQTAGDPQDAEVSGVAYDIVHVVVSVLKGYGIGGDNALHIVRVIRSALHGFVSLEIVGGFGLALSLDHSFKCLLDGLEDWLDGMSSQLGSA